MMVYREKHSNTQRHTVWTKCTVTTRLKSVKPVSWPPIILE